LALESSFIAQRLYRIEFRGPPRRVQGGKKRKSQRQHNDVHDVLPIDNGRHVGQKVNVRRERIRARQRLNDLADAFDVFGNDHAQGKTDLTEDQLAGVVEGVCDEAASALSEARRCGLLPPLPRGRARARAHGLGPRAPHATVQ